ncbi:hypothetical protein FR483_N819R [Paramecium bursaria Chlorella virus FR483]|uniref:Uncharacterized protein N819R n=1 Tax=Paramecium bursaria Chlorella virus FR483 TaxID=399781 RepID=A7J8H3_PBCVF|nr:hypothetical protein FR483_N819R [Paramecium bursaria Chlorella virus FR483]ABT16104.1 hypothetical protein FR483_N819R [Paramecium bursaria Chlorella virus FR483]
MSSRIQLALVKRLERQIKQLEKKETKQFYRNLNRRVRQFETVNDHFDDQKKRILDNFDAYYKQIEDSMLINKLRFELCLNDKLEDVMNDYTYIANHEEVVDIDDISKQMMLNSNSHLFFQGLYPTNSDGKSDNNDAFYAFVFIMMAFYTFTM